LAKKSLEVFHFCRCILTNTSFHAIRKDSKIKPIKEKDDMPKYQVMMRNYFSIPNPRAFDNVS
jgi:hypothetical protein